MNTNINGIMNLSIDGKNNSFRFNSSRNPFVFALPVGDVLFCDCCVPYCVAAAKPLTFKFISSSMVAMLNFRFRFVDGGNSIQNVIASKAGIVRNIKSVYCGGMPSAMSDAYDNEPKMPAPPVPDAHALITRLPINYKMKTEFLMKLVRTTNHKTI